MVPREVILTDYYAHLVTNVQGVLWEKHLNTLEHTGTHWNTLEHTGIHWNMLQCAAVCCSVF